VQTASPVRERPIGLGLDRSFAIALYARKRSRAIYLGTDFQKRLAERDRARRIATSEKLGYLAERAWHCQPTGQRHPGLSLNHLSWYAPGH